MPKKLTPMRAIRKKCLDCCADSQMEVRLCDIKDCPLHPYRMGKRPETIAKMRGSSVVFKQNNPNIRENKQEGDFY